MNNDDYLKLKQIAQKYEEKINTLEDKQTFVKMLDGCISSPYDSANVSFVGNVVTNGFSKNYKLNNDCLKVLIERTKLEISILQDEIQEMSIRSLLWKCLQKKKLKNLKNYANL